MKFDEIKKFGKDAWNRLSIEEQKLVQYEYSSFIEAIVKVCSPTKEITSIEFEELHDYIITEQTLYDVFDIIWDELENRQDNGYLKDIDLCGDIHGALTDAAYKIVDHIWAIRKECQ